jgi:hypothetical protein
MHDRGRGEDEMQCAPAGAMKEERLHSTLMIEGSRLMEIPDTASRTG